MTEQIVSAWENLAQFLTSKITSAFVASATIVTSQASTPVYINFSEDGFLWFTYANWCTVIGSTWLLILMSKELYKLYKNIADWWQSRSLKDAD